MNIISVPKPTMTGIHDGILEILLRYQNPVISKDKGKVTVYLDYKVTQKHLESLFKSYAKDLCERVVGKDENVNREEYQSTKTNLERFSRNQLRTEQRKRLAEEIEG